MICVELRFTDNPARLELRPQHRERLAALHAAGDLVMPGPWADESGAMLVFGCEPETVDNILADDPYYSAPGVTLAGVREWNVVTGG